MLKNQTNKGEIPQQTTRAVLFLFFQHVALSAVVLSQPKQNIYLTLSYSRITSDAIGMSRASPGISLDAWRSAGAEVQADSDYRSVNVEHAQESVWTVQV